jgi:hypothetical protein
MENTVTLKTHSELDPFSDEILDIIAETQEMERLIHFEQIWLDRMDYYQSISDFESCPD